MNIGFCFDAGIAGEGARATRKNGKALQHK
jgi:hypothetical protein